MFLLKQLNRSTVVKLFKHPTQLTINYTQFTINYNAIYNQLQRNLQSIIRLWFSMNLFQNH